MRLSLLMISNWDVLITLLKDKDPEIGIEIVWSTGESSMV